MKLRPDYMKGQEIHSNNCVHCGEENGRGGEKSAQMMENTFLLSPCFSFFLLFVPPLLAQVPQASSPQLSWPWEGLGVPGNPGPLGHRQARMPLLLGSIWVSLKLPASDDFSGVTFPSGLLCT